jgi:glutamine synthetase type III
MRKLDIKALKIAGVIIGMLFCLALVGCGTSEADEIDAITTEAEALGTDLAGLLDAVSDAGEAEDVGTVCSLMEEIDPKMERLSELADELRNIESADRTVVFKLLRAETGLREGLAPTRKLCAAVSPG